MQNKYKVVYLLHSSSKHEGSNKSLLNMLIGLIEKNITPFIVLPSEGDLCPELEKIKVQYYIVSYFMAIYPPYNTPINILMFFPRLLRTSYMNLLSTQRINQLVNKINPDIIHSNVGPLQVGHTISKTKKIPHVWHIREYQDLDFDMHPLYSMFGFKKKLQYFNNYPVAITKDIYKYFALNKNARVIYNGIQKAADIKCNIRKDNYFLFVGRLTENKGIRQLLIAFQEFNKEFPDYELLIAGDTSDIKYKESLLSFAKESLLYDKFKFLGTRDDIPNLMANATALIVPSLHEGFGRITAEAMFNGCLVIGNNTGGTKEILEADTLGLLYNEPKELVDRMKSVAENGIECFFPIIEKAQERAQKLYSIEQNTECIYRLYMEILKKK